MAPLGDYVRLTDTFTHLTVIYDTRADHRRASNSAESSVPPPSGSLRTNSSSLTPDQLREQPFPLL